jgi:hypothetical protein
MGRLIFGTEEKLECIQPLSLKGHEGEPLCLAYKTTTTFFGAGVRFRDDGYVLKVQSRDAYYPLPEEPRLSELQGLGLLPRPLPSYSIPAIEYAFGYSLWIVIAAVIALERVKAYKNRRRTAEEATIPTSYGPPAFETKGDLFVANQATALLAPGERVQHQAYALDRQLTGSIVSAGTAKAYFAILTDRRLILIRTRVGAFAPLLENRGVEEISRDEIVGASVDDSLITISLRDGTWRSLWIPVSERHFSSQRAFRRDVPRLLDTQTEASVAVAP